MRSFCLNFHLVVHAIGHKLDSLSLTDTYWSRTPRTLAIKWPLGSRLAMRMTQTKSVAVGTRPTRSTRRTLNPYDQARRRRVAHPFLAPSPHINTFFLLASLSGFIGPQNLRHRWPLKVDVISLFIKLHSQHRAQNLIRS